jgi:hypothetical protein
MPVNFTNLSAPHYEYVESITTGVKACALALLYKYPFPRLCHPPDGKERMYLYQFMYLACMYHSSEFTTWLSSEKGQKSNKKSPPKRALIDDDITLSHHPQS